MYYRMRILRRHWITEKKGVAPGHKKRVLGIEIEGCLWDIRPIKMLIQ